MYLEVSQSLRQTLGGQLYFLGSLDDFFRGAVQW